MEKKKQQNIAVFKKKDPMSVPANYFEDFSLKMANSINEESIKVNWINRLSYFFQLRVTAPLSLAILLAIGMALLSQSLEDSNNIAYTDAESYLLEEVENLQDEEFFELAFGELKSNNDAEKELEVIDYLIDVEELDLQEIKNNIY